MIRLSQSFYHGRARRIASKIERTESDRKASKRGRVLMVRN